MRTTNTFTIIQQEPFDYTKWQENLFEDLSIEEISRNAALYRKNKQKNRAVAY